MKKKTVISIMYDFDKTLSTRDMQEYTFIPGVGMEPAAFWKYSNELARQNNMDKILASMFAMLKKKEEAGERIRRSELVELGGGVEFYPGVESWFERVNSFAESIGCTIEHYIISSGMKEIIEGTSISRFFKSIFASEFLYDENGYAVWPANSVNYSAKTQYLYRINKGLLDLSDDESLNNVMSEDARPMPFRNMIYIGDGLTDVPCMKLVKQNGGYSIAVYTDRMKAGKLILDDRVNFIARANYSESSELQRLIEQIAETIRKSDVLVQYSRAQRGNSKAAPQ